ncbi:major facilitator family transporter [Gregarina niphandrodes]|uniref:Major facilitator family transporter n=1 Tax=Gregarina niphandrodes TaxID=110365 RepID=A0A023BDG4_GRENI|nr:major facilitator family transporter [Gregarina niphandrodes]EZG88393.1 major facilitator family transporter [Gregarina niphandrodes]|eukprot:XP_011128567.1 major facilitator family transporter [Gregarina niphandrodes]
MLLIDQEHKGTLMWRFVRYCSDSLRRPKRGRIFLITYLAYATLYATRKPFSVVKTDVQGSLNISTDWLGIIDTCFLGAYAIGQLLIPTLLARYPTMSASAILVVLYGGSGLASFTFGLVSSPAIFSILWIINGLLHAAVFPLLITCLSPWFNSSQRGKVMGAWTTSQQTGAIAATGLSAWMSAHLGWRSAFTIPGIFTFVFGIFVAWAMQGTLTDGTNVHSHQSPLPMDVEMGRLDTWTSRPKTEVAEDMIEVVSANGMTLENVESGPGTESSAAGPDPRSMDPRELRGTRQKDLVEVNPQTPPQGSQSSMNSVVASSSGVSLGSITDVKSVSCSYFCVKCIRYSLLFWLPYYLATELRYPHEVAGYTSIIFDVGGVLGGIGAGQVADRLFRGRRIFVAMFACLAGTLSLIAFSLFAGSSKLVALFMLGAIGIAIAAADSIIGGSAATDLCERAKCSGSTIGAVSGIINGCGSVGAVLQGYLTSRLTQSVGWPSFYLILSGVCLCGSAFLVVPAVHELASVRALS